MEIGSGCGGGAVAVAVSVFYCVNVMTTNRLTAVYGKPNSNNNDKKKIPAERI